MEREKRRRRDAEVSAWPPPPPPPPPEAPLADAPWGDWGDEFHPFADDPATAAFDDHSPWRVSPWEDFDDEGGGAGGGAGGGDPWDEPAGGADDCGCGGAPPPVFNLPPPPPIPRLLQEGEEEEEGSGCDVPPPSEACPALLVAGDAHTRQRLQPPLAALVVAAATLTLVFIIAALVCWRYRRQRGRRGPSKSTSDLTNGVIYEDLPSGPAPRVVPAHTHPHDTHTLAPMELLDMKLTSHAHTTSYGGAETGTPAILQQYQPPVSLAPPTYAHEQPSSPPYSPKATFEAQRSARSSQELYNPTYEEISTGSDTTSVSSASVSSEAAAPPQARERIAEGPGPPAQAPWAPQGSCSCSSRRSTQGRRGTRGGRARKPRPAGSATSTGTTEGSEYHEALLPQLVSAHPLKGGGGLRHPALPYTIQGTSDGRTSTSSSSDLPVDRIVAREPRYYVGIPAHAHARSPATPEGSSGTPSTSGGERPSPTERGLPPLPSRSDRYRIYFTTERRRGGEGAHPPASAARTLDPGRKRQRRHDARDTVENEPLYHEL
ncbi:nascent polypeptide-associated complex subunit alpha, muscle-specific form-like isoform X2 [Penaeus japonicus]|nr:nascent polypeptide-associated complex subunit alpha, muscle-specific form-like isoform X2 [Penaeus japonicus]